MSRLLGAPALEKVCDAVMRKACSEMMEEDKERLAEIMLATEAHGVLGPKSWLSVQLLGHKWSHGRMKAQWAPVTYVPVMPL